MHPKDLYSIIIKVFGLFIIKDILFSIPYIINPILYLFSNIDNPEAGIGSLIFSVVILLIYFSFAYILIFKTNSILKLFKLDDNFMENDLSLNISKQNILLISLVLLGGYILIDEIPNFCNYAFKYYQQSQNKFAEKPSISNMLISGIKILIAFLILGERKKIIELISKDQNNKQAE